jgi:hypothetical protein
MFEGSIGQRSSPQVGVQDNSGGIDYGVQRITKGLAQLLFHRGVNSAERQFQRMLVKAGRNLLTQLAQNRSRRIGYRHRPVENRKRSNGIAAQELIHGRQLAEQVGFSRTLHREIIP